jgi:hypothetical protein
MKSVACFSPRNKQRQRTTLKPQSTTFSPSKTIILYTLFLKTPLKNAHKAAKTRVATGFKLF